VGGLPGEGPRLQVDCTPHGTGKCKVGGAGEYLFRSSCTCLRIVSCWLLDLAHACDMGLDSNLACCKSHAGSMWEAGMLVACCVLTGHGAKWRGHTTKQKRTRERGGEGSGVCLFLCSFAWPFVWARCLNRLSAYASTVSRTGGAVYVSR
jgi:hypothetical protein